MCVCVQLPTAKTSCTVCTECGSAVLSLLNRVLWIRTKNLSITRSHNWAEKQTISCRDHANPMLTQISQQPPSVWCCMCHNKNHETNKTWTGVKVQNDKDNKTKNWLSLRMSKQLSGQKQHKHKTTSVKITGFITVHQFSLQTSTQS